MMQHGYISVGLYSSRILELCVQIPKGITDQVIQNDMPELDAQQRVMAINRLLSQVKKNKGVYGIPDTNSGYSEY